MRDACERRQLSGVRDVGLATSTGKIRHLGHPLQARMVNQARPPLGAGSLIP